MPRKHRHRQKIMKGGFLDTLSNWGYSISQGASNLWNKTKNAASSATSSLSSTPTTNYSPSYSAPSYSSTSNSTISQPMSYGGKSRRRRRMKGGFKDNSPTTGLAVNAATFSGQTAKPHTWVGGRTKKHYKKHRHNKSCKKH